MGLLSRWLGGGRSRSQVTTVDRPFEIPRPTIGFLVLQEASGALALADRQVLAPLFHESLTSNDAVPQCAVLFLYCTVGSQGEVVGSSHRIRDLIRNAGAYVAVVASENVPEAYFDALGPADGWSANIVLTVDRKADRFALFFHRLFEAMFDGQSMPMAWVELAPQIPGHVHPDAPVTMMAAEAGHLVFGR